MLLHVPNYQRSISHGDPRGVIADACSVYSEHETGVRSPSAAFVSLKNEPKQTTPVPLHIKL